MKTKETPNKKNNQWDDGNIHDAYNSDDGDDHNVPFIPKI